MVAERCPVSTSQMGAFRDSTNAQLLPTRQLELFREKTKLEADATLSPQERASRIDTINKKLAELQQAG